MAEYDGGNLRRPDASLTPGCRSGCLDSQEAFMHTRTVLRLFLQWSAPHWEDAQATAANRRGLAAAVVVVGVAAGREVSPAVPEQAPASERAGEPI